MTTLLMLTSSLKPKVKSRLFEREVLCILFSPFMPLLVRVFSYIAETGRDSNLCLEKGFLPMPVHYYCPVPEFADLKERQVWQKNSSLSEVDFLPDQQVLLLHRLGKNCGNECNGSTTPTGNTQEFYTENSSFRFGCAASLYSIHRYYKPHRVLGICSGYSSLIFSIALSQNAFEGYPCDHMIVDPPPLVEQGLPCLTKIISKRVELIDGSFFEDLGRTIFFLLIPDILSLPVAT